MAISNPRQKIILWAWLGAGLLAASFCFGCVFYARHVQVVHLLGYGFKPWADTGLYIQVFPAHKLSLIRSYSTADNVVDAIFPAIMAGLAALLWTLWWILFRASVRKPRPVLAFFAVASLLSAYCAYGVLQALSPPQEVVIDLDAHAIVSSESGTVPLSQVSGFGCALLHGHKSHIWYVGIDTVGGGGAKLIGLPNVTPFPDYNTLPELVAKTLSDFVSSHGTVFPTA